MGLWSVRSSLRPSSAGIVSNGLYIRLTFTASVSTIILMLYLA